MKIELNAAQKNLLETRHRVERDGRVRDRIKAVLLKSEGWTNEAIGQALRIHSETVAQLEWLHYIVQGLVKIVQVTRGVKWHKESMIRS